MEHQLPVRRYDTDPDYRAQIQQQAKNAVNRQTQHIGRFRDDNYGAHPMQDGADIAALAVVSSLTDRSGVELEFDEEINEEIADVTAEIIRQATQAPVPQEIYEEAAKTVTFAPRGKERDLAKTLEQFVDALPRDAYTLAKAEVVDLFEELRDDKMTVEDAIIQAKAATDDSRVEHLMNETRAYVNLAEKWALTPGMTLQEACHGVAHDAYLMRFDTTIPRVDPQGEFNPSRVYGAAYDVSLADEIQARKIRAAKDLFG